VFRALPVGPCWNSSCSCNSIRNCAGGAPPETIRLIGTHVWLIDEEFRQNPRHHRLFIEILWRAPWA